MKIKKESRTVEVYQEVQREQLTIHSNLYFKTESRNTTVTVSGDIKMEVGR